jgi:small subunit ribosomal protein S1
MVGEDNRSLQETGTDLEAQNPESQNPESPNPELASLELANEVNTLGSGPPEGGEMANLLEGMGTLSTAPLVAGEVVQGKVLKIDETEVVVDVGLKTEATVPVAEFQNKDGQLTVAAGDTVDVWIERYDEVSGAVTISHKKAAQRRIWEDIERAAQEKTAIKGRVVDRIKGGMTVDVGVSAFLPASHADIRPHSDLDALKGQEITCKIIKINRKRNNVVVSRKLALEDDLNRRKDELAQHLVEGLELVGKVKNIAEYGVFVDLGGLDGLLHITDLSWGRVGNPSEVVQVGQEIRVKVLKHDVEKGRVSLGLKQLTPDPWEMVPRTYHPGDRVTGKVVSLTDYGAFVELEPGVEGLIHISEMSWSKRLRHPSKILNLGDNVDVGILEVSPEKRRISLSLKVSLPDPWTTVNEKYVVGGIVEGRVRNLTDFGAFVEIEDGVDGLIHLANMSWDRNLKHPSELLKKGQKVNASVLAIDPANRRLALGLKQLQEDPWQNFFAVTKVGDVVHGKVSRQATFGLFVEIRSGIEGLCHISEVERGAGDTKLEVGNEYDFRVLRLVPGDRKIALSMKKAAPPPPPPEPQVVKSKEPVRLSTMAEAMSSAGITFPGSSSEKGT